MVLTICELTAVLLIKIGLDQLTIIYQVFLGGSFLNYLCPSPSARVET